MTNWKTRLAAVVLAAAVLAGMLAGCGQSQKEPIASLDQLNSPAYTITLDAGSLAATVAQEQFPQANLTYSASSSDAYLAVEEGKADAFVYGKIYLEYAIASQALSQVAILPQVLSTAQIAAGISPERQELLEPINAFFAQIREDGTLADMINRWIYQADDTMPQIPRAETPEYTIRFATSGMVKPTSYIGADNQLTGFDLELIQRLALYLNADFTVETMGYDALVASLQSGRVDVVIADLNVTPERLETIVMSEPYMTSELAVMVRKELRPQQTQMTTIADLHGKHIGYLDGAAYLEVLQAEYQADSQISNYMSVAELVEALRTGRIDAYVLDEPMARGNLSQVEGLRILEGKITEDQYAYAMHPENTQLHQQINEVLARFQAQGVLAELEEKWVLQGGGEIVPPADLQTPNGVLTIATNVESIPFSYLSDGEMVGYDIELISRIAWELGYEPQFENFGFVPSLNSVLTGRADVAVGCITYTEERAETILFSDPVYAGGVVAVVLEESEQEQSFLDTILERLERTLIRENRWKLIVSGLAVTMRLSFLSVLFGTLLGFCFSFALRSGNALVRGLATGVSTLLDGLPLLVVLMVLYYVVLAKSPLSAEWIGVIGFSLDFANSVAGTLNTGLRALDRGQTEGALAMGYSKMQIFTKITFPQAVNHMFGQYSGSVIALIKGTSIIGYITVQDLTKASDIIRSMTYEAFTPLIITAILYFILCRIFVTLLGLMARKLDPKHRKRTVKGVKTA